MEAAGQGVDSGVQGVDLLAQLLRFLHRRHAPLHGGLDEAADERASASADLEGARHRRNLGMHRPRSSARPQFAAGLSTLRGVAPTDRTAGLRQAALLCGLALLWRGWLSTNYYGWEEGDYGNLMMVREVQTSGFTWFRPSHMPGWYAMGAAVRSVLPFPRLAPLLLTMAFSVLNVGLAALVTRRLAGAAAAWMAGLWLVFQPEMALYGASTLRSPVYTSLAFVGLALLLAGRRDSGFAAIALSFITRMEGFFAFYLPALWAWWRDLGRGARGVVLPVVVLAGPVIAWQAYITGVHGESFFVLGPLGINLDDVAEASPEGTFQLTVWLSEGLATAWALASWLLPRKVGWVWLGLAGLGSVVALRGRSTPGARSVVAFTAFAGAFWLAEGFLSHHEPNHNLYWVWMMPVLPFLAVLGGLGWRAVSEGLRHAPRPAASAAWVCILLAAAPVFAQETRYQHGRSADWYRPQLDLSRWMEEELPAGTGVLVSSIPEVYLKRIESPLTVHSWWLLPGSLDGSDRDAFGQYLADQEIDYVQWFSEEWTDSNRIAPWLRAGTPVYAGPVALSPVDREDGYGWILYVVSRPGVETPPVPPPFGQGHLGPGWGL